MWGSAFMHAVTNAQASLHVCQCPPSLLAHQHTWPAYAALTASCLCANMMIMLLVARCCTGPSQVLVQQAARPLSSSSSRSSSSGTPPQLVSHMPLASAAESRTTCARSGNANSSSRQALLRGQRASSRGRPASVMSVRCAPLYWLAVAATPAVLSSSSAEGTWCRHYSDC